MFINEVEHLVGLSKKSIRYYEENGLLSPKRNVSNSYRVYSDADILKLKMIKCLRELGVPIRDLKRLTLEEITLQECMNERVLQLERVLENYQKMLRLCRKIAKTHESYEEIDITAYFHEINVLNKEGFTMKEVASDHGKKIKGAIGSSILFSLFFFFFGGMITYFQFTEVEKMPWFLYLVLMMFFIFPLIGIFYNLGIRIKEIEGGEEDEASKY